MAVQVKVATSLGGFYRSLGAQPVAEIAVGRSDYVSGMYGPFILAIALGVLMAVCMTTLSAIYRGLVRVGRRIDTAPE